MINVIKNSNCTEDILSKIIDYDYFKYFIKHIPETTTFYLLKKFYNKITDPKVKQIIINHPNWKMKDFE